MIHNKVDKGQMSLMLKGSIFLCTLAMIGDVITTYIGLTSGYTEMNPVVGFFWNQFSFLGLLIVKILTIAFIILGSYMIVKSYNIENKQVYYYKILSIGLLLNFLSDGIAVLNNTFHLMS